ncbi:hypothetical protein G7046_g4300 [Stylonectria norvegica]|nr:hypothetical protein G7046_g4300 [Stylonectria norvegica]
MFDVIWTDPDRELVGEHRAKKEKKKGQKDKDKTLASRSSMSTRSSRSSTDSPFGFLRSRAQKQATANSKSSASSGLKTPSLLSSRSPLSIDSDAASYRHSVALLDGSDTYSDHMRTARGRRRPNQSMDSAERAASLSSNGIMDTTSSDCADSQPDDKHRRSAPGQPSPLVQTLGPSSYVTKRTEVSWIPRDLRSDTQDVTSEVLISSEHDPDQPLTPPTSPEMLPIPVAVQRGDSPVELIPGLKYPNRPKSPMWAISFKPNNPDAWRPPDEWDCPEPERQTVALDKLLNEAFPNGLKESLSEGCLELSTLQREVKRMAAASPDVILSRLKEVWSTTADENVHKELELEKKRWMLSALHHLDPVPGRDTSRQPTAEKPSTEGQKILALYESQATASYLAALHFAKQVYHISATPLSHELFPNIHPILVPSVSSSVFPVAPQLFETVYSLSLPALCSSSDIPGILRNISKCLKPGGCLQLTLIDPLPCAGTLGHRMRAWLEEHLLLNLERHFRCMNPSRLFPQWLGDASLRGPGSTLTTAKFYAIPENARRRDGSPNRTTDQAGTEKEIKAELRSLVGRMLWMEVWGTFVTAGSWWWEDQGCVEECLRLGTFWEYNVIEGVRDN